MHHLLIPVAMNNLEDDPYLLDALAALTEQEWGSLIQHAALHRVLPSLARLGRLINHLPPATDALIRELHTDLTNEAYARMIGYQAVLDELHTQDLQPVILKGFVLATECYASPTLRMFNDLDIFIPPDAVERAEAVFEAMGFQQAEVVPGTDRLEPISAQRKEGYANELQHLAEFLRRDPATGMLLKVDVHVRLSTIFDHLGPDASRALSRGQEYDSTTGNRTLTPADFVTHLGYHAWWDGQSIENVTKLRDLRLYQFVDIHHAIARWGLTCPEILTSARELGVEATTHWALAVTNELLGALTGHDAIDMNLALEHDRGLADRWIQRDTAEPFTRWTTPAWERIFDTARAERIATIFLRDYVSKHTNRGDVLQWINRADMPK